MKEHPSATLKRNGATGLPPLIPRDIATQVANGYKHFNQAKPRSTALPSAWRKGRKFSS